ncbi:MAG: SemiSWEET family transporter [Ferruginibacter sp.]
MLPQLVKIIKERKAENVSIGMLLILFLGIGLWIIYGVQKKDIIIVISNSVSFVINLLLGFFAIKYKQNKSGK